MKKFALIVILAVASCLSAKAQDIIKFRNGEEVEAKVVEVTSYEIRYKRIDNPNGPVYIDSVRDIASITYENGIVERYNEPYQQYFAYDYSVPYSEIAGKYDTRLYTPTQYDPYSPAWSGIASFFMPGLGQCVTGEWGRGLGFFAANIGFGTLELWELYNIDSRSGYEFGGALLATLVAHAALNIWGISDAVKIAKAKNMYFQDSGTFASGVEMKVQPSFGMAYNGAGGAVFTPGVSLSFSF